MSPLSLKRNHQDPHCWHSEICGQGKCKKGHGSLPWHAVPHLLPYKLTQIQYASIRINTKSTNFSQTFTKRVSFSASKQLSLYWTHPWALLRHFQGRVNYNTLGQFQRGPAINPKGCRVHESSPLEIGNRETDSILFVATCWKYLSCHFWRYTTFTTYPKFSCIKKVVHVSSLQKCYEIDHPWPSSCKVYRNPFHEFAKKFIFPTFWKILSDVRLALAEASGCEPGCWWDPTRGNIGGKISLGGIPNSKFIPCFFADHCCKPLASRPPKKTRIQSTAGRKPGSGT